ncbi:Formate hydrogenlyase transcriptional activator [Olavius algarvensis Delta 1 endosymbiont]|nr:Formate hydrogenlyase transcriptional activator [Olavius algarvensis Delta 1 endosymbiont]
MKNSKGYQNGGDILIVDDELSSLRTLSDILTAEGYGVRGAPDGSTALMIVENEQPELILLDVRMPEMDGFEVCRQIKANENASGIPVLFLSALNETADKVKGFAAGGLDFITKPFQAEEVLARIDTHLTLSRLSKNLEGQISERTAEIKHNEQVLAEQLEFERLIADIASQLAQTRPEQLDESIESTLQALGLFFGTQRAFLAQFTNDGKSLFHRKIWSAEGIDVPPHYFEMDMAAASPWFAQQVRLGKAINTGPGLVNLPDESGILRDLLKRDGVNSGVIVPVRVENRSLGMLGLDTVDQPRDFPPPIVDRLKIVADTVGSTIFRVESQTALQSSLDQIRKLKDRIEQENIYLREEIEINFRYSEIVGESPEIIKVLNQAEKVAAQTTCVLILGETGTGKELLARAIHKMSPRHKRQMVNVNCAALPGTLIESELFGREKGAFTGAISKEPGRFEVADGSTIFLDEIGDLPIELQSKILRVLEEDRFERLGSSKTIAVDVRIIAATNYDLQALVHEGRFRKDLFYRLNTFPITLPPLRDRREDIPLLTWTFVNEFVKNMGKVVNRISKRTMTLLYNYPWPGNVRELKNVIERAMILSADTILSIDRLGAIDEISVSDMTLKHIERDHILKILNSVGWRVSGKNGAAEILGLKESTLRARMKKLGIERKR